MGDTLRLGGYLVSPAEIENHLIEHDAVKAAQVVAVRIDDKMRAYAFIIPTESTSLDEEELMNYCSEVWQNLKCQLYFITLIISNHKKSKRNKNSKVQT